MRRLATPRPGTIQLPPGPISKAPGGCSKCSGHGASDGSCPQCEAEQSASLGAMWRGGEGDFSQVPLHATARAHGADDGSGPKPRASGPSSAEQSAAGPAEYCSPTARFTSIPSGTLAPTMSGGNFIVPFDMDSTFSAPIPCNCSLGVYRQYVRGSYADNGTNVPLELLPGTWIHPTNFQEDGLPSGFAYGHREQAANGNSKYTPDQLGGCDFHGHDAPGFYGVQSGHTYKVKLDFRGELKDISANSTLVTRNWSVVGTGTAP